MLWDVLWAALVEKARNPVKFKIDASDVTVVDRPGCLARSTLISPAGKRVEEHIYASERTSGMIYRVVDPQTKCETDDERVIAVKEGPLHRVFPSPQLRWLPEFWKVPVDSVKQMLRKTKLCSQQRRQGK